MTMLAERRIHRLVLVLTAAGYLWLAVSLWHTRHLEVYLPRVWPVVMLTTATLCLALAVRPTDGPLFRFTGALAVIALASRVGAVVLNELYGGAFVTTWRAVLVATVYLFAAYGMHSVWRYEIGPWVKAERLLNGHR